MSAPSSYYAQYKADTHEVSMFLARAAIETGYSILQFEVAVGASAVDADAEGEKPQAASKSSKANAKKRLKQKALKQIKAQQLAAAAAKPNQGGGNGTSAQSRQKIPQGNYAIKVSQYVELASHIAEHKVEVPDHLMHRLYRCIKLRMRTLQRFLGNPDWSTFTHEHFLNVLREVGSILHEAREKTKTDSASKEGRAANRFASLDVLDKCEDDIDADIDDEEPTRPSGSAAPSAAAQAAKAQFDLKQSIDEAIMSAFAFFVDLMEMREYISTLWKKFRAGTADLMVTSITTQLAMEMLRRPHDELLDRILPLFDELRGEYVACDNSLEVMLVHLLNTTCGQQIQDYKPQTSLPSYKNVKENDITTQTAFEAFLIPIYQVLKRVVQDPSKFPYPYLIDDGVDTSVGSEASPFLKWRQLENLLYNSYADYLILFRYFTGTLKEGLQFFTEADEMANTLYESIQLGRPTLVACFAAQIFIDINFILGDDTVRAHVELKAGAEQMLKVLKDRKEREPKRGWKLENEDWKFEMRRLDAMLKIYSNPDLDVTTVCSLGVGLSIGIEPETPVGRRMLMPRSPMMCGMVLIRLRLFYHELGRSHSDMWYAIPHVIHLYHACWNFGTWDPSTYPLWADLVVVLNNHDKDAMFGGKEPQTAMDALIGLLKVERYPASVLQAVRRGDTSLPAIRTSRKIRRTSEGLVITLLMDQSSILELMKSKYLRSLAVTPVDISNFEDLLVDLAFKAEKEERMGMTLPGPPRPPRQRSKVRDRSPKKLLETLQNTLISDGSKWRFDYFSMNLRCIEVIRTVQQALHDDLKELFGSRFLDDPDSTLAHVVRMVLRDAAEDEMQAAKYGVSVQFARMQSPMLQKATKALAKFLDDSGETDKEIDKMALHMCAAANECDPNTSNGEAEAESDQPHR
ncbi:unnamed protein product [Tilletia controversa]|uniref:DUF6604 domain-containing protein n=1 Tax=Tilletia controversa TaxID=13291 RepID=A0A8X7MXB5_9BASI|nr:hypothetical protein CF328_g1439 [Tilletia controversa]KAE8253217.1 hypothetical protein A4X06_0g1612 [Tilletia controversa]CAD6911055.1 unnamed protein product [Tilletia controversa]CAD6923068.1 unnamed protein product [Tilletia controversa]CAD6923950.1 unnamed protein product [Tilletia controversa]